MIRLTFAPDLVEEAVLLAEPTIALSDRRIFRLERDPLYAIDDPEQRDRHFSVLHMRWFVRLGLHRSVEGVLAETSVLESKVEDARVLRARTRAEEGADLVDHPASGRSKPVPVLVIRLRPAALLDERLVRALLAHELMHVRDMLDPEFGYERTLPIDSSPLSETMLRDRYRVLWDATIDGRLSRARALDDRAKAARRREFEAAFPMLGSRAAEAFETWFMRDRFTHQDLIEFALRPTAIFK